MTARPTFPTAWFTNQVLVFRGFNPIGQTGGTTLPMLLDEYTLSGDGLTEIFVTAGGLCGPNVSYLINPHSKLTVRRQGTTSSGAIFNFSRSTTSMYIPLLAGFG